MTIISPYIDKNNKRCVYKMFFEDGSYYIGSTIDLKRRIGGYRTSFTYSIGSVNKLIAAKVELFSTVCFEVLEIIPEWDNPRFAEDKYIKKSINDPLLLNRSLCAFNNSGMIKSR